MKFKSLLFFCAMLLWGLNLSAVELKLDKEYLSESGQYEEDYIFLGNNLQFLGKTKDLFFLTEKIDFSGTATLAVTGLGEKINVTGNVKNGVKAAGGTINIDGIINGTSFLAGETVTFGQESQMNGDTFVGARNINIKGKYRGNLYAAAAEVTIENEVEGNVKVHVGRLRIPERGRIIGDLTYHSERELSPEEASRVSGKIKFEINEEDSFFNMFNDDSSKDKFSDGLLFFELLFKVAFIVFGLLILLFPVNKFLEKQYAQKEIQSYAIWGLLPIFVYPSALIISIVLLITLPLAAAMFMAFMPLVFISKVLGITIVGGYLVNKFNLNTTSRFLYFLIGAVIYSILSLIPFFGFLLLVFVSSIGCGLILFTLFNKKLT